MLIFENSNEAIEIQRFIDKIFNKEKELPAQLFKDNFNRFYFDYFDWADLHEFWDGSLKPLAEASGDDEIYVLMLYRDVINNATRKITFYYAIQISMSCSAEEYWKILNSRAPEEIDEIEGPFLFADKVVWIPKSLKWAIWGERPYSVAVLGFDQSNNQAVPPRDEQKEIDWRGAKKALLDLINDNFFNAPKKALEIYSNEFLRNYTNQEDKDLDFEKIANTTEIFIDPTFPNTYFNKTFEKDGVMNAIFRDGSKSSGEPT